MKHVFRAVLSFAFLQHGLWNLGEEARLWWESANLGLPVGMREPLGVLEIVLAFALWVPRVGGLALLGVFFIMAGATLATARNGFLYKNGGCEVPFLYTLVAGHLIFLTGGVSRISRASLICSRSRIDSRSSESSKF